MLTNGTAYRLRLSCAAGTTYFAYVIRKGVDYGFDSSTDFGDGVAQKSANSGGTWSSALGNVSGENDLQFYLVTP